MRILFCDIDDTMTTRGLLPRETFDALWNAREAGLRVVPVTGRPAGWCDHIARMWPVDGVIGENGAFYFRKKMLDDERSEITRVHVFSSAERETNRRKLDEIRLEVLREIPGAGIASDQSYREYDLAIDFCEDVPRLPPEAIQKIVAIFERRGATAKVSSIHVNGWFGDYDKLSMAKRYIRDIDGADFESSPLDYAFVGDSPNDEPMFAAFPISFGVANIAPFLPSLRHKPARVMGCEGGAGFAQVVAELLSSRRQ